MTRHASCLAALLLAWLSSPASAQDQPEAAHGRFGMGVFLAPFDTSILVGSPQLAPISIAFTANLGPLRLEPEVGVFTAGTFSSALSFGLGALYVHHPGRDLSLYGGPRLTATIFDRDDGGSSGRQRDTAYTVAAAVGGEWWASRWFALGVEARLAWVQFARLDPDADSAREPKYGFRTTSFLCARFYFF